METEMMLAAIEQERAAERARVALAMRARALEPDGAPSPPIRLSGSVIVWLGPVTAAAADFVMHPVASRRHA